MWALLFTLLSLVYTLQAIRVAFRLAHTWHDFWDDRFTPEEQQLAQQVGFFLIIPFGVLLHEFGHAVATWMVGGQVAKLRWFLFWGYVEPVGTFTPAQQWWIALSGNLVSVLFGFALLAPGYRGRGWRRVIRYLLLETGYFQTMYALVGYPLLSFIGFVGDWVVIYDFKHTPVLSALTALVHLAVLLAVWAWWNSPRMKELRFLLAHGDGEEWQQLRRAVREHPLDVDAYLAMADYYAQRGDLSLAEGLLHKAIDRVGKQARVALRLGRYALAQGNTPLSLQWLSEAVNSGELPPSEAGEAHALLGIALVQEGRSQEALDMFAHVPPQLLQNPTVLYWRGVARRNVGDTQEALADLQALVRQAPDNSLARQAQAIVQELRSSEDETSTR